MIDLPGSVQLGPYTFSITDSKLEHAKACLDNDGMVYGYIRYGKCQIILDPDQEEMHKRVSLMHELLHAIWHLSDWTHKDDELPMRVMATGMVDTLRRNPNLVRYILGET